MVTLEQLRDQKPGETFLGIYPSKPTDAETQRRPGIEYAEEIAEGINGGRRPAFAWATARLTPAYEQIAGEGPTEKPNYKSVLLRRKSAARA